jgi:hypothetical protein
MQQIRRVGRPGDHVLTAPFVSDNWESAKMLPLDRAQLSPAWKKLDATKHNLARRFRTRMPAMFYTNRAGERISIRFKGTGLRIYDLLGPDCGQVKVTLDGGPPVIKPRFDAYCTYHRLATLTVAENLPDAIHTIELELLPDQPDKAAILARRNQAIDNPQRYDDTAWYAGAILIVGELLPTEN